MNELMETAFDGKARNLERIRFGVLWVVKVVDYL